MKETEDIEGNEQLIRGYIDKFGFMPEHKFEYFAKDVDSGKPMFIFDDDFGYPCYTDTEGKARVVSGLVEPLTAQENVVPALEKFIIYCLADGKFGKVILETRHEVRQELKKRIEAKGYTVRKERYHLTWPVFVMKNFDATLSGGKWKKIRHFRNKFFKDYAVEVDAANEGDREALLALVVAWAKKRTAKDRANYKGYLALIKAGFPGFDMVRVIRVDKKPVSLFGGWRIANSNNYYSCLGIYDYDYENIGEVSNVIDLALIKEQGYDKVDLGGGEDNLTNFKKKFFPDEFYRTDVYTVVKKAG